jgi:hypothetical protein
MFISQALLGANTLSQGGMVIKPNIKYKEVVKRLDTTSLLADATCDFTATDTITQVERVIEPKELQVNLQLCKKDFRSDWDAITMGFSVHDNLPPTFADYLISYVVSKVAAGVEVSLWSGASGTGGEFDGIETLIALDANLPAAQEIGGTTVTSANVVAEMRKVTAAIPAALYQAENAFLYVSQNVHKAYVQYLAGFGTSGLGAAGTKDLGSQWFSNGTALSIDGIRIFLAQGMTADTMIFTTQDNLWFGTGLMSDQNEVKVIDMADIDGSQNVRMILRFTAATQYGVAEDIVTYGIVNAAN